MRKFFSFVLAALMVAFLFSACSAETPAEEATEVASLNGTWTADKFEATIATDSITVYIVTPDSKSLYWTGTFPVDGPAVKSVGDHSELDKSLMGSSDTEKIFAVGKNEISFDFSMLGTTKTIHLSKKG